MGKAKIRKSIIKRFKFTKTGKILRRPCGLNHFLAKKSSKKKRLKRKWRELSKEEAKIIKKHLYYCRK